MSEQGVKRDPLFNMTSTYDPDRNSATVEQTPVEESLLPMHNGATVIRADIKAGTNPGDGQGYVLARDKGGKGAVQYVTWWVRRDAGDPKWFAFHGEYHSRLTDAVKDYEMRRGMIR